MSSGFPKIMGVASFFGVNKKICTLWVGLFFIGKHFYEN